MLVFLLTSLESAGVTRRQNSGELHNIEMTWNDLGEIADDQSPCIEELCCPTCYCTWPD